MNKIDGMNFIEEINAEFSAFIEIDEHGIIRNANHAFLSTAEATEELEKQMLLQARKKYHSTREMAQKFNVN
ncbi:hypothetical protein M2140_000284 [Clostridiales Family XIII bacterium PM5-7]